jgi:PPOX class probable F420-dependent enzyme
MTTRIPEEAYRILDSTNFAHVATLMPDGTPQVTPVWVDRDGDVILINTAKGRLKHRNLERDPRIAISIADQDNPYVYLQVRGRAEFVDEGADSHIDKLASKYMGVEAYPYRTEDEQRVIVRITPEAVDFQSR